VKHCCPICIRFTIVLRLCMQRTATTLGTIAETPKKVPCAATVKETVQAG